MLLELIDGVHASDELRRQQEKRQFSGILTCIIVVVLTGVATSGF